MTWRVWRAQHNVTDALKEPSPLLLTVSSLSLELHASLFCVDMNAVGSPDISVLAGVYLCYILDCVLQGFVSIHIYLPISDRLTFTLATVRL